LQEIQVGHIGLAFKRNLIPSPPTEAHRSLSPRVDTPAPLPGARRRLIPDSWGEPGRVTLGHSGALWGTLGHSGALWGTGGVASGGDECLRPSSAPKPMICIERRRVRRNSVGCLGFSGAISGGWNPGNLNFWNSGNLEIWRITLDFRFSEFFVSHVVGRPRMLAPRGPDADLGVGVRKVSVRHTAAGEASPAERQVSNSCGHSRVARFNSQNAKNGWCGGLALPANTGRQDFLHQHLTSLVCCVIRVAANPLGWLMASLKPDIGGRVATGDERKFTEGPHPPHCCCPANDRAVTTEGISGTDHSF